MASLRPSENLVQSVDLPKNLEALPSDAKEVARFADYLMKSTKDDTLVETSKDFDALLRGDGNQSKRISVEDVLDARGFIFGDLRGLEGTGYTDVRPFLRVRFQGKSDLELEGLIEFDKVISKYLGEKSNY